MNYVLTKHDLPFLMAFWFLPWNEKIAFKFPSYLKIPILLA